MSVTNNNAQCFFYMYVLGVSGILDRMGSGFWFKFQQGYMSQDVK